ncbi:MAG: hypothetical protein II776_06865, partial [Clostridia bacterium]|nr:hypothetical protein [Clostridia bacterium]
EIGEAVAVNGPVENVAVQLSPGAMQDGFLDVIRMTVSLTKELMGATDAALGNVQPDNTSAIIALQQSSAVPLELQKKALYDFTEQLGMIWLDFILHYYDASRVLLYREEGDLRGGTVSPADLEKLLFSCTAQVGASSHWSEMAQVSTLDNLLQSGRLSFSQYLERLPDGYIGRKDELLEEVRRAEKEAAAAPENPGTTDDFPAENA